MTPEVDAGKFLIQKRFALDNTINALKLLKILNELAAESFLEIMDDLLEGHEILFPQPQEPRGKLHYSWEIPNKGYIDLNWDAMKISAFLRSMDYGILETLGKPKLRINDKCYIWKKYRIEEVPQGNPAEKISISDSSIVIEKDNYKINLLKISQTE